MRKNRGFTLVELLVVMAIIAILASIVVPNVVRYIARARVTRAVSEVSGMDLSLTAILTDAGRSNLSQLFNKNAAQYLFGGDPADYTTWGYPNGWPNNLDDQNLFTPQLFEMAADVYARVAYDLLRLGRDSMRASSDAIALRFIDRDTLAKLGTNYMDIGLDPWGQVYRMWPGPWRFSIADFGTGALAPGQRWPVPFRIFSIEAASSGTSFAVKRDNFILDAADIGSLSGIIEDYETWPTEVGFPADANKSAFVWSYGNNNINSQMLYTAIYDADPFNWYYQNSGEDIAAGDDITSWDSGASWQRFYQ